MKTHKTKFPWDKKQNSDLMRDEELVKLLSPKLQFILRILFNSFLVGDRIILKIRSNKNRSWRKVDFSTFSKRVVMGVMGALFGYTYLSTLILLQGEMLA